MHLNHHEKLMLVAHLVQLAGRDKEFDQREIDFINKVVERLGLEFLEVDRIKSGEIANVQQLPKDEITRLGYFHHLVLLMAIDGNFDPDEESYLGKIGFDLGIRDAIVKEVIRAVKAYFPATVPAEKLKEIYLRTSN